MEEKRMVRVGSKGRFMKASALLAAEMIGGAAVVGTSQSAAAYGLSAALFNLGLALSLFVGVFAYISITGASAGRATIFVAASRVGHPFGMAVSVVAVSAILTTAPTILVAVSTLIAEFLGFEITASGAESARILGVPVLAASFLLSFSVKSVVMGLSYSFAPRAILGALIVSSFIYGLRERGGKIYGPLNGQDTH